MKLKDLLEYEIIMGVIEGNVKVPQYTTKLNFTGVTVRGDFDCSYSKITSLEGSPSKVDGAFLCFNTQITSLKGAPSHVGKNLFAANTHITSLHNVYKHIKYIGGDLYLPNGYKTHLLGVMLIKGLKNIVFFMGTEEQKKVIAIINRHLTGDRDIHQAQEELIEAGFAEFAKI